MRAGLGGTWSALAQQALQLLRLMVTEQRKTNALLEELLRPEANAPSLRSRH